MSRTFEFTVTLRGSGNNVTAAWNNATEAFEADPGPVPEDAREVTDEEADEEESDAPGA